MSTIKTLAIRTLAVTALTLTALGSAHAAVFIRTRIFVAPVAVVTPVVVAAPVYVPLCRFVAVPMVNAYTGFTFMATRRVCN